MFKRFWSIIALTLLVAGCFFSPMSGVVSAQENEVAAEEENPQGAGVVILMAGIVAILIVGGAYASQQRGDSTNS